jgi:hypothetical protein
MLPNNPYLRRMPPPDEDVELTTEPADDGLAQSVRRAGTIAAIGIPLAIVLFAAMAGLIAVALGLLLFLGAVAIVYFSLAKVIATHYREYPAEGMKHISGVPDGTPPDTRRDDP